MDYREIGWLGSIFEVFQTYLFVKCVKSRRIKKILTFKLSSFIVENMKSSTFLDPKIYSIEHDRFWYRFSGYSGQSIWNAVNAIKTIKEMLYELKKPNLSKKIFMLS